MPRPPFADEESVMTEAESPCQETPAPGHGKDALAYWIANFSQNPFEATRKIRESAVKAPDELADVAVPLLVEGGGGEASPLLTSLVSRSDRMMAHLSNPNAPIEDSVRIVEALSRHDPMFDTHFARSLLNELQVGDDARRRGMEILASLNCGERLIPVLIQFLRNRDAHTRSKAALILGQVTQTPGVIERLMRDENPRVRANLLESLWNCRTGDFRWLFLRALKDPNARVIGNALIGLHKLAESHEVATNVAQMAQHPDASLRATAAWVMGEITDKQYVNVLRQMIRDRDFAVRRNAYRALRRIHAASAGEINQSPS